MKKLVPILLMLWSVNYCGASTAVSKKIKANEIWTIANSPYILSENCSIDTGISVTVMPGVEIRTTGGLYNLTVNGAFYCYGKFDSIITINKVVIQFTTTAINYNSKTGNGCQLNYAKITSLNTYSITTSGCDFKVDHCTFENYNYSIYNMNGSDSVNLLVTNCKFKGNGYSFVVMGLYSKSSLEFTGNSSENNSYLYMAEKNNIKNNYFQMSTMGYGLYFQSYTKQANIQCNYFKGGYYAIYATALNALIQAVEIKNNQFDSCSYVLYVSCYQGKNDSIHFHSNNLKQYSKSIYIAGCSGTGLLWYDLSGNYWGTTDTTVILASIYDKRSYSNMPVKANINAIQSSPVSTCWPTTLGAVASLTSSNKNNISFTLFPNPTSQTVKISTTIRGNYRVCVFDVTGRKLLENSFTNTNIEFGISQFSRGTYIVKITDEVGVNSTQKLVIE